MPKVSVILGSARPGGVDISLRGLADQTYEDFEIIFVDRRYHRRHELVLDTVRSLGIKQPFFHVPNHRNDAVFNTTCAGFNTGFMLADGEIGILLMDYAYAPPGWIEAHLAAHAAPRFVMAPNEYFYLPPEYLEVRGDTPLVIWTADGENATTEEVLANQALRFNEIQATKFSFDPSVFNKLKPHDAHQDPKLSSPEGPAHFTQMHTKNDSFPVEHVLDINGIDENSDRGGGLGDTDFGRRLTQIGLQGWLAPQGRIRAIDMRFTLRRAPKETPHHGRWVGIQGPLFFSPRWDAGIIRADNPYDMRERREQIWRWRELSQKRYPVIPDNVVPDEIYWPNFPWAPCRLK